MSPLALCVVCVSERRDVVNMSSLYYGSIPASTFIMYILQIKVSSDTSSGVVMCNRCNSSLNNFYKFYKMVRDAQHKYNEMKLQLQDGVVRSSEICFVDDESEVSTEYLEEEYLEDEEDSNEFTEQNDVVIVEQTYPLLLSFSKPNQQSKVTNVGAENSKNCHEMSGEIIKEAPTLEADFIPRSERATTAVFEKYKVEDIYSNRKWKISEEEKDEIFQLYIDMKCNKCDAHFSNYNLLDQHCTTIHDESALVTCDDFTLPSYQHMERHILYKHILNRPMPITRRKLPCKVCNKWVDAYYLREHMAKHLPRDKRDYQCNQCNAGFGSKGALNTHIIRRHSTTKFPCNECGKLLKNKYNLQCHMKQIHNPSVNYLCPDCGKEFAVKTNFLMHVDKHRGIVEEVKCKICDKLVKKISYPSHKLRHKAKKQCPHCSYKGFNIYDHVKRVHQKLKPYACAVCGKKFHKAITMEEHIAARHTGIPRYTCEFCSKTFMSSGNHHSHRKRMHSEQLGGKKMAKDISNVGEKKTPPKKKKVAQ